jgi:hypothetical protein
MIIEFYGKEDLKSFIQSEEELFQSIMLKLGKGMNGELPDRDTMFKKSYKLYGYIFMAAATFEGYVGCRVRHRLFLEGFAVEHGNDGPDGVKIFW